MKRETQIAIAILCLCAVSPILWLGAIDWIQFDERAVGEGSPYYEDVVNRPAKQIYGVFTSEHHEDGTHRINYLTSGDLSGYATSSDLNSYMLRSTYDPDGNTRVEAAEVITDGLNTVNAGQVVSHINDASAHITINDSSTSTSAVWSSSQTTTAITEAVGNISVSEYALRGTGTGELAYATFAPAGFFTGNTTFSLYGIVLVDQLNRAESFYKHTETYYSQNVLNFGKTSDNKLQLTLGSNTYTSGVVWTADTIGVPVEVGVVCNKSGNALWFLFNGEVFASQAASYTFPAITLNEIHTLGSGLDGDVFVWHVTKSLRFNAGTKHTPISEGLSQCPACLVSYDFDESTGSALTDRYAQQKGSTAYNLSINGTWQEYVRGY